MKKLSEFEKGYIAAALDCEGNIEIEPRCIRIRVGNRDFELLRAIQKIIGGKVYAMSPSGWKDRRPRGQYYVLQQAKGDDVRSILEQVLPHLICKREKALAALKPCAHL